MAMTSIFTGTLHFRTRKENFEGPFLRDLVFELTFSDDLTSVNVSKFDNIKLDPVHTSFGWNTITISMKPGSSGTFTSASGAMVIDVGFRFDHSLPNVFVRDSDLTIKLTTGQSVAPGGYFPLTGKTLDAQTGQLMFVSGGAFSGGYLNEVVCGVELEGALQPVPQAAHA